MTSSNIARHQKPGLNLEMSFSPAMDATFPTWKPFRRFLNSLHVDQSLVFEIERKRMRASLNVSSHLGALITWISWTTLTFRRTAPAVRDCRPQPGF